MSFVVVALSVTVGGGPDVVKVVVELSVTVAEMSPSMRSLYDYKLE